MVRPFVMFVKGACATFYFRLSDSRADILLVPFAEPIVLCLSLLSGFSDALIFTFLDAFGAVFGQWGFTGESKSS